MTAKSRALQYDLTRIPKPPSLLYKSQMRHFKKWLRNTYSFEYLNLLGSLTVSLISLTMYLKSSYTGELIFGVEVGVGVGGSFALTSALSSSQGVAGGLLNFALGMAMIPAVINPRSAMAAVTEGMEDSMKLV